MKVMMHGIIPVKQADGTWKVVEEEHEEEVPDLGREHLMCNMCKYNGYPECLSWCKAYLPQKAKSSSETPIEEEAE